jgi:O-acetylhomoserine/O-acetylserine sulfhydrylase-like pyridoxal-dependent enzyme
VPPPPARSTTGTTGPGCLLCAAERITHWYHEDDVCWIADCTICATPMVVWRRHGLDVPDDARRHMLGRLSEVAGRIFDGHYFDDHMRNIPDHFHVHARPEGGFFGHGFRKDGGSP